MLVAGSHTQIALIQLYGELLHLCLQQKTGRDAIEPLLQKLKEHGPVKILWRKFFSPQHLFAAAVRCHAIGLDHMMIINSIQNWPWSMWREMKVSPTLLFLDVVEDLLVTLPDERVRQNHLEQITELLITNGAFEEAKKMIPRLSWLYMQCLRSLELAKALRKAGRETEVQPLIEFALKAVRERPEELNDGVMVSDDMRVSIIFFHCETEQLENAMELVPEITGAPNRCDVLITIAQKQKEKGLQSEAFITYRRAAQAAFDPEIEHPEAYLHWIMAGIAALGLDEQAEQIIPMAWAVTQSHVRDVLISELTAAGRADRAIELLENMEDPWHKCQDLLTIARIIRDKGDEQRAQGLVDKALALLPSPPIGGWVSLVNCIASFGRWDVALEVAHGVQETLVQDDVLWFTEEQYQVMAFDSVLNEMCRSGEPDQALALAREITDILHRARLMAELALTLLEKGERYLARSVAEECWQIAATMPNHPMRYEADEYHAEHDDDSWRSYVLTDLLRFWERLGEMKKAEEFLIESVKTPEAIVTTKPT